MKYFMYKLVPPRPTFNMDMNEKEKAVMQSHIHYWDGLFEQRKVLIYGPVLHSNGVYGLAILEVTSDEEAQMIVNNDPAITSQINTYELVPMLAGHVRQ